MSEDAHDSHNAFEGDAYLDEIIERGHAESSANKFDRLAAERAHLLECPACDYVTVDDAAFLKSYNIKW